jgi:hypothetical protein
MLEASQSEHPRQVLEVFVYKKSQYNSASDVLITWANNHSKSQYAY